MGVIGDLIGQLERLINEHGSATILKEHLALVNTKLALLKENIEKLEKENADIKKENADIKQQLDRQKNSENFVEARGAFFKRLPDGGYSQTPYCPRCHNSMSSLRGRAPYECSNKSCGHRADFKGAELGYILADLPK